MASLDDIKFFNKELNSWKYGVLINGKVYTDQSKIDWSQYKTIPVKDIEKYKVGVCWDFVNYQHDWFKKNKVPNESYFWFGAMDDKPNTDNINTHTFSIITIDGKKYWFESAWGKHQGIHEVSSYKDVVKVLNKDYKNFENDTFKYNPDGLDNRLPGNEFFKRCTKTKADTDEIVVKEETEYWYDAYCVKEEGTPVEETNDHDYVWDSINDALRGLHAPVNKRYEAFAMLYKEKIWLGTVETNTDDSDPDYWFGYTWEKVNPEIELRGTSRGKYDNLDLYYKSYIERVKKYAKEDKQRFKEYNKLHESYDNYLMMTILDFNKQLNNFEYIIPNHGNIITQIKVDDFVKYYRLLSSDDFKKYHGGICWDYVQYEAEYFKNVIQDVKYKTYYHIINDENNMPTHTFLLFEMNGIWYWFESSWKTHVGVRGYKSEKDALAAISYELQKEVKDHKGCYIKEYNTEAFKPGMTCAEYMKYFAKKVNKITPKKIKPVKEFKGEVIEESAILLESDDKSELSPNFKAKGYKDLSQFKRIEITKDSKYEDFQYDISRKEFNFLKNNEVNEDGNIFIRWIDTTDESKHYFPNVAEISLLKGHIIEHFHIYESYRGYGLSKQILSFMIECGGVHICAYKDNQIAIKVYEDFGFKHMRSDNEKEYFEYPLHLRRNKLMEQEIELDESVTKTRPDVFYNKDKFESGEINICFVTGLAGSGKSTFSHKQKSKDIEVYELDDIQRMYEFSDEKLKEYGDMPYSFFKGPGKVFRYYSYEDLNNATNPGDNFGDEFDKALYTNFINYSKQYASSHKNKKYIIEGCWLMYFFKPEDFKNYAVYIKGTSMIKSFHRASWRDSQDNSGAKRIASYARTIMNPKNIKFYLEDNKILDKWIDYFKEEPEQTNELAAWLDDDIDFVTMHESTEVNLTIDAISKHVPDLSDLLDEADYSKVDKTSIISTKVYKLVEKQMPNKWSSIKRLIGQWITNHYEDLYATAPYKLIPFTLNDYENFWKAFGVPARNVDNIMKECYFYGTELHPRCAKSGYIAVMIGIIRYHLKKKNLKDAKLATIYTAFSGQMYASIYSNMFKYNTKKEVMDYVVNTKLTDKFELRKTGNVFGAVEKYCNTWIESYTKIITGAFDDEDYKNLVQQLRDRVKSFLKNIAILYYDADKKNEYMNYSTDSMDQEDFHLMNTITSMADKATEKAINYMTTKDVNYQHCGMVADQNIRKDEIKNIMSSIYHNPDNIKDLKHVVNIIVIDYLTTYPEDPVSDIKFINHAMQTRPNTKNKDFIYIRETIVKWLNDNSVDYVRRKSRTSTAISYFRAVQKMIVLAINTANR